jgi:hypothetical protein
LVWLILLAAVAVLFFFNPVEHSFFPPCLFHKLTGLNCPGCGATRAVHAMLHLDFATAVRDNALLVCALPLLAWMAGRWAWRLWRGQGTRLVFPAGWLWIFLGVTVLFGVVRNLPAFAWLSP